MSHVLGIAVACLVLTLPATAQGPDQPDMTVDQAARRQVIDGVLARLREAYVFSDTALAMERALRRLDA